MTVETAKLTPLALEPKDEPPLSVVYHCRLFPAAKPFRLVDEPLQTAEGVAVIDVGVAGNAETVTVFVVDEEHTLPSV